jgi:malate dehydrogenase
MSVVAVLGAGPFGAAIAHALARRARIREIRLIDAAAGIAAGKALDIRQSGPIDRFDTRLSGTQDVLAAVGASAIVLADAVAEGEWQGDAGLALVRQLMRAGTDAPFVFAGAQQLWLMEAAARELNLAANRIIGTAASAMAGAARALAGVEVNGSGVDVQVTVAGRPPSFVVGWSAATVGGSLLTEHVAAHRLLALNRTLKSLWPPGPQAVAAATTRVVEGLIFGSRQLQPAATVLDGELGVRRVAAMLPLELGGGRVLRCIVPSLSSQERTDLITRLEDSLHRRV